MCIYAFPFIMKPVKFKKLLTYKILFFGLGFETVFGWTKNILVSKLKSLLGEVSFVLSKLQKKKKNCFLRIV